MSHVFANDDATAAASAGRHDAFYWRFVVTAVSFATFGIGAAILSLLVLPAMRLLLPRATCQRTSRLMLSRCMRVFVAMMSGLGGMTYEFRGTERLGRPGQLVVANHPTLLDAVFLLAFTPQAICVAKHAVFRSWLTRNVVLAAGYISNEFTPDMITRAGAALSAGQSLIMFPEGTRSQTGVPLSFHRSAASIGVRAASRVTPVYIRCQPSTLKKGEPWYRVPARRPHFSLIVGEDLDVTAYRAMRSMPLASRQFNEQLRGNFQGELHRLDGYTAPVIGDGTPGNES
jgi:1-acyl-sn-glycerol-3-phosphate acyltransferase